MLTRAMDAYSLRHKAIASNIANIGTSGYRPKVVRFEEELAAARQGCQPELTTTNERHLSSASSTEGAAGPSMTELPSKAGKSTDPPASGINDVDLDQEMTELAKNQIRYKFSARLMADTFKGLQESIRGTI